MSSNMAKVIVLTQRPNSFEEWLLYQPCLLTGSYGFNELIPIDYSCHQKSHKIPLSANALDHFQTDGPLQAIKRYYGQTACLTEESAKMWFYSQACRLLEQYQQRYVSRP